MASTKSSIPKRAVAGLQVQRKRGASSSTPRASGAAPLATRLAIRGVFEPDRVADAFGMSKGQLAETIGLNRQVFYKTSRSGAPKTQARMREMLEIVGRISEWAGGKDQAMAWYRAQPIAAFGGRTAESIVKSGQAAAMRDYLDHIAMGGFA